MAKVSPIQGNFNAGEVSPLLRGRVDADRYKQGLDTCLNMIPTIQGPVTRRGGTKFIAETKDSSKQSRIIPFKFSATQAYALEFGDGYIRFFRNRAQILSAPNTPYEIVSPYLEAELLGIAYTQSADVLYIVQANHKPAKLQRFSDTNWVLQDMDVLDGPYGDENISTVSASTATTTVSSATKTITNVQPFGAIMSITSFAHGYTTGSQILVSNIQGTEEANGLWTITVPNANQFSIPVSFVNPYVSGGQAQLFLGFNVGGNSSQLNLNVGFGTATVTVTSFTITNAANNGSGAIRITTSSNPFYVTGQTIRVSGIVGTTEANAVWLVTRITDTTYDLVSSVFTNAYVSGGISQLAIFAATDIGRSLRVKEVLPNGDDNWVWGVIVAYTNEAQASLNIRSGSLTDTTELSYRLGVWSDTTGYPTRIVFHEDRLVMAGALKFPERVDFSNTRDYENFSPSLTDGLITDSSGISVTCLSNEVNTIKWMTSEERGLPVGTLSGEWVIRPSVLSEALTPANASAKKVSTFGSADNNAVVIGKSSIYAQAGGLKTRELSYSYNVDGFRSVDLTILAEHITIGGILSELCSQKIPQPILWCARKDGYFLGMTFDRDVDAVKVGWHKHSLGGFSDAAGTAAAVESMAIIPEPKGTYDDVWVVARRYVGGQIVRYVEMMTKIFETGDKQQNAFFVDSGLSYDSPLTITGITQGASAVVSVTAHGLTTGQSVVIREVAGMTELNGNIYEVGATNTNDFELLVNSSSFKPYVSGGETRLLISTISGLDHLIGETVSVFADGAALPNRVVDGTGNISLSTLSATVNVGYSFNSDIKMLRLDAGSVNGSSIGKLRRTGEISVMLERSLGMAVGMSFDKLDQITFRTAADEMTKAPSLFTGLKRQRIEATADTENQICIRQAQPLPLTVLAVIPQMVVEDQL